MKKTVFLALACCFCIRVGLCEATLLGQDSYELYWEKQYEQCKTKQCVQEVYNRAISEIKQKQLLLNFEVPQIIEEPKEQKIEYGYNAYSEFVPKAIGGKRIKYGFNSLGEYVPVSIEE